jgi:SRSO17 transposase
MAARLAPDIVRQTHQSLHHFVTDAPWSDEALLEQVRHSVLPAMKRNGPVIAWNCRRHRLPQQRNARRRGDAPVRRTVATEYVSLTIAWRLYLPEEWAEDRERREKTAFPKRFPSKPSQKSPSNRFEKAVREGVPMAPVLADARMATHEISRGAQRT